jgi:hypothetical protein
MSDTFSSFIDSRTHSTVLAAALDYASKGYPVFACKADKTPNVPNGFMDASTDPETIQKMFTKRGSIMLAVPTGEVSGFDVIDIDPRNQGDQWPGLAQLPPTHQHGTPSGGSHYILKHFTGMRLSRGYTKDGIPYGIADGVDVRADGGYVCVPPSPGYSVAVNIDPELWAEWPAWLIPLGLRGRAGLDGIHRRVVSNGTQPLSLDQAKKKIDKLLETVPNFPEGGKHHELLKLGLLMGGIACWTNWTPEFLWDWVKPQLPTTVRNYDNARKTFIWGFSKGEAAPIHADSAYVPSSTRVGLLGRRQWTPPVAQTSGQLADMPSLNSPDDVITWMNTRYAVVNHHGRILVVQEVYDLELSRTRTEYLEFESLRKMHMDLTVMANNRSIGAADYWLANPNRRFYSSVVFNPKDDQQDPLAYNLWRGWAVTPKGGPEKCKKFRDHIKNVLCDQNPKTYTYLMKWLARMVQKPWLQAEVAVVIKSSEGAGKGTLTNALLRILGRHGFMTAQSRHVVGDFTGQLHDCILLVAEEAFFAGDRVNRSTLKAMITEPYLSIEPKGLPAFQSRNYLHIMMNSNEEWVVPASLEARRFFVLRASDSMKGNRQYFTELYEELENGGLEAFLEVLLNIDIGDFDIREFPKTEELRNQQAQSLSGPDAWWFAVLERGKILPDDLGWPLETERGNGEYFVSNETLLRSYSFWTQERRNRQPPLGKRNLGVFMNRMGFEVSNIGSDGTRVYGRNVESWEEAKEKWTVRTRIEVED